MKVGFYKIARFFLGIKNPRVRLLCLLGAHVSGMRCISIYIDPVLACNLRCRMCYFSDPQNRPAPAPPLSDEQIAMLERALFRRAAKMQIGCGAEPMLYTNLQELIAAGKRQGIPYIEITTNGQFAHVPARYRSEQDWIESLVKAGLDGITLSVHGTTAATYEYLMQGASYERLKSTIALLGEIQKQKPEFKLRVNYTINNMNVQELAGLDSLFGECRIDVLQLRPIQNLGDTTYSDFDMSKIYADYDRYIGSVVNHFTAKGTQCIAPTRENLLAVDTPVDIANDMIEQVSYCYVSSKSCYHADFDLSRHTYDSYQRENGMCKRLLKLIFSPTSLNSTTEKNTTKKMNYSIS